MFPWLISLLLNRFRLMKVWIFIISFVFISPEIMLCVVQVATYSWMKVTGSQWPLISVDCLCLVAAFKANVPWALPL